MTASPPPPNYSPRCRQHIRCIAYTLAALAGAFVVLVVLGITWAIVNGSGSEVAPEPTVLPATVTAKTAPTGMQATPTQKPARQSRSAPGSAQFERLTLEEHCTDQWLWLNEAGKYSNVDTLTEAEWLREFEKINDRGMKDISECGAVWDRLQKMPHETACHRAEVEQWTLELEPILNDFNEVIILLGDMFTDAVTSPSLMNDRNWKNNALEQLTIAADVSEKLLWTHFPSTIAEAHFSIEAAVQAVTLRDKVLREAIAGSDAKRLGAISGSVFSEIENHLNAFLASLRAWELRCQ